MSGGDGAAGVSGPWRLAVELDRPRCAQEQMRADLALADEAAGGPATLRIYRWQSPALSIGRFQPEDDIDVAACAARGVDVVRRPTGGRALLHGGDLTYAVGMPQPRGRAATVDAVYRWIAGGPVEGLGLLGVPARVASFRGDPRGACFASLRGSDLRVGGRKVCGSAQVWRAGAVLQHGSLLVDRLDFSEADLLRYASEQARAEERRRLEEGTVTLRELGVDASWDVIGGAIVEGFRSALNLDFTSRVATPG